MIRTLGDFIGALSALPPDMPVRFQRGAKVGSFHSWRGDYAQLTLDTADEGPHPRTVADLLEAARAAAGAVFEGYKGGMFTMTRHSELYADSLGEYTQRRIEAIVQDHGTVLLITDAQEWIDRAGAHR